MSACNDNRVDELFMQLKWPGARRGDWFVWFVVREERIEGLSLIRIDPRCDQPVAVSLQRRPDPRIYEPAVRRQHWNCGQRVLRLPVGPHPLEIDILCAGARRKQGTSELEIEHPPAHRWRIKRRREASKLRRRLSHRVIQ